jgi:O-acetyl-ADP-ribose deacetylase (regulator of RNase III)
MDKRIKLVQGDITKLQADAIVNAANSSLMGGGGVDGAIHRAGGKAILEECIKITDRQGRCKTGNAVITTGGNLPARYVIHTVGPVWNGGKNNEAELLANCYKNSLNLAVQNGAKTVAFPNISTGVYRFPKGEAAKIAIETVNSFLVADDSLQAVTFVCFDQENLKLYEEGLK